MDGSRWCEPPDPRHEGPEPRRGDGRDARSQNTTDDLPPRSARGAKGWEKTSKVLFGFRPSTFGSPSACWLSTVDFRLSSVQPFAESEQNQSLFPSLSRNEPIGLAP